MGLILSGPLACLGSCAGSCAGAMCCKAVSSGFSSNRGSKVLYILIAFLTALAALLIRYQAGPALAKMALFSMQSCTTAACYQTQGTYRVCMAMFIFFLLMGVLSAGSPSFHYGFGGLKLLLFAVLFVASFLVPNDVADVYADISIGGAAIFLLLQIMIFICMSYEWNAWWTGTGERPWLIATVVVSLTLWFGSLIVSAFYFHWFGAAEQCGWQQGVITVHILAACGYTLLGLSNFAPHGTLLTSSTIFAYGTYTLYGALAAERSECVRIGVSMSTFNSYGLALGAISLCWSAFSVSKSTIFGESSPEVEPSPNAQPLTLESQDAAAPAVAFSDDQVPEQIDNSTRWSNVQFHALMALSALFMTMTITNWTNDVNDTSTEFRTGSSVKWVALTTTWTSTVLYLWTLCAPRLCPNRDFGVQFD